MLVVMLIKFVRNRDGMAMLTARAFSDTDFNRDGHETFLVQTINILPEGRINMLITELRGD
jgi:cobalamin biosynthesis Co2+ chelatase CbiK